MNLLKNVEGKELLERIKLLLSTKSFYLFLGFIFILLFIFLANTFHESYPDEFDNILGGWNILNGNILYKDFFTHHGPAPYFIASIVEIFSGNSFVKFRVVYSIFLLTFLLFSYWFYRKSLGTHLSRFFILFLIVIGISATYFWGHMLLADNTAGFFIALAVGLIAIKHLHQKRLTKGDLIYISVLSFLSIFSSLTYIYLIAILYGFLFIEYFLSNKLSFLKFRNYFIPVSILALPYLLYFLYLLITGSVQDYFFQNFEFNQKYYIYNYPRADGETSINPLRFAIIITHTFLINFTDLLVQIRDFNFYYPFNITLAVGNTALLIYIFTKKKYKLLLLVLLTLIFANTRSNPLTSSERDYQSAVYIIFSLLSICYLLYALYENLRSELEYRKKMIYTVLFLLTFIYSFVTFIFLGRKFIDKTYQKYMGTAPLIYNRPQIAPIINSVITKDDYSWIGPFEFEELLYLDRKNASRYQIFNPGMGKALHVQDRLINDFEKHKPKIIWFDKKFYILRENPEVYGKKFVSYIDRKYTTLIKYRKNGNQYLSVKPIEQRTDLETKLYIRNENVDEIIFKLITLGVIKEVKAK